LKRKVLRIWAEIVSDKKSYNCIVMNLIPGPQVYPENEAEFFEPK
jgi:hypothetical protein